MWACSFLIIAESPGASGVYKYQPRVGEDDIMMIRISPFDMTVDCHIWKLYTNLFL